LLPLSTKLIPIAMIRIELITRHKTYISKELVKCCELLNKEEQVHFLDTLQNVLTFIYNDDGDVQIDETIEKELYIKYRHKMLYFTKSRFIENFIRTCDQHVDFFKEKSKKANCYSDEEYQEFFMECYTLIDRLKTVLYTASPNSSGLSKISSESEQITIPADTSIRPTKHKSFSTRPQQVLLMYYIARGLGIKGNIDIPISKIAEFYHHLLGWEFTKIDNSSIYKMLKSAPYIIKTDKKKLYADLSWVKEQLQLLQLVFLIELVDKELKELELFVE
jgi:hypothetical protein